ncbi:uncharacterized protein N7484_011581 [Penicillium longicatenatum]|uniref:uncharacterized protein n=1 Tax=Penicillium longicatenatum TaxID=1561947 RepID=UPI0025479644|nr:uncharacterized protein N7484_011581 [Penicillium longicatenatum]KAJ5631481.1 hypothetical protein N7484_011581 [Penicillium longicatenatum]
MAQSVPKPQLPLNETNQFAPRIETPQSPPSRRRSSQYANLSPQRAKHLERNRIAANKCRMKKKQQHQEIEKVLSNETAKHEHLLSVVTSLKEEVWHLKNTIFDHARCDDPQINLQLAIISEKATQNNAAPFQCPSPTFSASTYSDNSSGEASADSIPPEAIPATMTAPKMSYDEYPDTIFETFIEAD